MSDSYTKGKLSSHLRKAAQVKDPPPLIEKITPHEIYLLDEDGERVKKICGAPKRNMPPGYVCLQSAGHKTSHPGYGACKSHDTSIPNGNNIGLWDRLNKDAGLPSTLAEYLQNASEIEEQHLTTVDEDIKALYGLLQYQLSKRQKYQNKENQDEEEIFLSNSELDLALKIMDKILKAKDLKLKLSRELTLDTSTIKQFVNQIFQVATQKLPEHHAKMLLNAFLEEVIIPFQTKGRIRGSDFQYDPQSGKLLKEVGRSE